uniref:Uncharacterized protein n=1 Tax=Arundo donax TaxID=35708 RepID=A0A0A9F6P8_ARUDO
MVLECKVTQIIVFDDVRRGFMPLKFLEDANSACGPIRISYTEVQRRKGPYISSSSYKVNVGQLIHERNLNTVLNQDSR